MSSAELDYPCVGVCMVDAESGYCLGCGRPPLAAPAAGTAADAVSTDAAAGMAAAASSAAEPTSENAGAAVEPAASDA